MQFSDLNHVIAAVPAKSDLYTGNFTSQVVSLKYWEHATFILTEGAGGVGTATLTVEACDDFVPTTPTAIPFRYRLNTTCNSSDTWGAVVLAPAAGYLTLAGAQKQILIEVDAQELLQANSGKNPNVRLKGVAGAAGACAGNVLCVLSRGRYMQNVPLTVLS